MTIERKALPNSVRFEVFKRDKFACQYCGRKAPDVLLNADHIKPVADGGTDDLMNLATSCRDCNSGKSDRLLGDDTAVEKSRAQAELIEERRQQVRMMSDWQVELASMNVETDAMDEVVHRVSGRRLTDQGKREARKLCRKYGVQEVIASIAIAFDQYDADNAWPMVSRICYWRQEEQRVPGTHEVWRVISSVSRVFSGQVWERRQYAERLLDAKANGLDWQRLHRSAEEFCLGNKWRAWTDLIDVFDATRGQEETA